MRSRETPSIARWARAARASALLASALLAAGLGAVACQSVPGMEDGAPCNAKGHCASHLKCVRGTCRSPQSSESWLRMEVKDSTNVAEKSTFYALAGRSDNDVYAAGTGGLYHFDGSRWSQLSDTSLNLIYVDQQDAFAASSSTLYRKTGSDWLEETFLDGEKKRTSTKVVALARIGSDLFAVQRGYKDGGIYKRLAMDWQKVGSLEFAPDAARGVGDRLILAPANENRLFSWTVGSTTLAEIPLPGSESRTIECLDGTSADDLFVCGDKMVLLRSASEPSGWIDLSTAQGAHGARDYQATYFSPTTGRRYLAGNPPRGKSGIESCEDGLCAFDPMDDDSLRVHAVWGGATGAFAAGNSGAIWRVQWKTSE